jgi:hypothetical protein
MDFTIFDHREHMTALTWLGRKEWMLYQDIPAQRAISAKPRKLILKPKQPIPLGPEYPIVVNEKEFNRHPPEMWKVLKEIINVLEFDVVGTFWYNTLAKALAGGPKIFRPTAAQCEALEHVEARYSFKDYKQPFPVITLEIPEEYRALLNQKYGIKDSPKYVLVNHDDTNKFIAVSAFYSKNNIISHITPDREEYSTIEENIVRNRERRQDDIREIDTGRFVMPGNPELQGSSEGEFNAAENVQRLGINFAMMMSLYTVNVNGPLDPKNYEIWKRESRAVRSGGIPTNRAIEAQQKLAASMQLIQFDQKVEFYDEIEERVEVAQGIDMEKLHKSPRSHWRRGHFAMQPCGLGRRERRMIFRKPSLVRANYFLGDVKDASVTYTMHPGRDNRQPPKPETHTPTQLPPPKPETHTPTQLPPPEPKLQANQRIEVVQAEDCPVPNGTQGVIIKVTQLGSNMVQVDAVTDDGKRFALISPPDEFKAI